MNQKRHTESTIPVPEALECIGQPPQSTLCKISFSIGEEAEHVVHIWPGMNVH